jgi:RNA polymerase sigma-54 factor
LMKLIQLPTIELEQKVQEEIEANPAIEEGVDEIESPEFEDYEDRDLQHVSADEINVDEYLSDDEVPRYRLVANNSSPDQEDKSIPVAMGSSSTQLLEISTSCFR